MESINNNNGESALLRPQNKEPLHVKNHLNNNFLQAKEVEENQFFDKRNKGKTPAV